jgi:4-hydroxy-tetrahydrodipicolinate synthase
MPSSLPSNVPQRGILAALWLPTDAEGNLLTRELSANLAFLKAHGVSGVLALGSTGEFPQFDLKQRKRALESVAEIAAPLPVIANVSDIRPHAVAELARFARRIGLPAITIMAPGFYPSSQDDLLAHFLHAADAAELPTFLYNFPELTGSRINLETVTAFADRARMAGIKQSGGEFSYHAELVKLGRDKNFVVFSGADTRLPEVFSIGAVGCIGGLVNIAPDLMVHLYRVCREGATGNISPTLERLCEIARIIDRLTFPLSVAAGMEARGLSPGAPKAVVSPQTRAVYLEIVAELRSRFEQWQIAPPSPAVSARAQ